MLLDPQFVYVASAGAGGLVSSLDPFELPFVSVIIELLLTKEPPSYSVTNSVFIDQKADPPRVTPRLSPFAPRSVTEALPVPSLKS